MFKIIYPLSVIEWFVSIHFEKVFRFQMNPKLGPNEIMFILIIEEQTFKWKISFDDLHV